MCKDKVSVRKEIKALRDNLNKEQVIFWSDNICKKLLEHNSYKEATNICIYVSKGNEVNTNHIINQAIRDGKNVYAPKVFKNEMHFVKIEGLNDLKLGSFGILEPHSDIFKDPEDGLIIMPGVAFDKCRNRIGFGGGYYDRYLSNKPKLYKIALAYNCQVVDSFIAEATDIKPDIIVTETGVIV